MRQPIRRLINAKSYCLVTFLLTAQVILSSVELDLAIATFLPYSVEILEQGSIIFLIFLL